MAISRKEVLLALIGAHDLPVQGMTRMQKLCFILEAEEGLKPSGKADFDFIAYRFGPYSSRLYDDLEALENYGLIESVPTSRRLEPEAEYEEELSCEFLLGDEACAEGMASSDEKVYRLTERGKDFAEKLERQGDCSDTIDTIRRVKSRFSDYCLRDLLRYVYKRHPDMTTESEIKDLIQ